MTHRIVTKNCRDMLHACMYANTLSQLINSVCGRAFVDNVNTHGYISRNASEIPSRVKQHT